jgi:hypothetical protein
MRYGYVDVRSSGFVVLPSTRILQYYKNAVNQTSGFNKDMFHWMLNEAKNRNLSPEGYEGGLLIDEMTIQQDIQFFGPFWIINIIYGESTTACMC